MHCSRCIIAWRSDGVREPEIAKSIPVGRPGGVLRCVWHLVCNWFGSVGGCLGGLWVWVGCVCVCVWVCVSCGWCVCVCVCVGVCGCVVVGCVCVCVDHSASEPTRSSVVDRRRRA